VVGGVDEVVRVAVGGVDDGGEVLCVAVERGHDDDGSAEDDGRGAHGDLSEPAPACGCEAKVERERWRGSSSSTFTPRTHLRMDSISDSMSGCGAGRTQGNAN
jgi:hypothetical protein